MQTRGDVQGDVVTPTDDAVNLISVSAGMAMVTLIVSGQPARICLRQDVTDGAARPTVNFLDLGAGASVDIEPGHCGVSGASAWQIGACSVTNGAYPTVQALGRIS